MFYLAIQAKLSYNKYTFPSSFYLCLIVQNAPILGFAPFYLNLKYLACLLLSYSARLLFPHSAHLLLPHSACLLLPLQTLTSFELTLTVGVEKSWNFVLLFF